MPHAGVVKAIDFGIALNLFEDDTIAQTEIRGSYGGALWMPSIQFYLSENDT
jgi:hypothetical protein